MLLLAIPPEVKVNRTVVLPDLTDELVNGVRPNDMFIPLVM